MSGDGEVTITEPAWLRTLVRDIADYPQPGVTFRDITPLLGDAEGFRRAIDELADRFAEITKGSPEDQAAEPLADSGAPAAGDMAPAQMGKQEALRRFTVDLTEEARRGRIDPIVGRDEEIRQVIDILMRRRQNNPILTGEAGVGKTAVVEGFAHRIVEGDVPPMLAGVRLLALDIGLLQAGASMKGEFEQRLRQVIDEVQASRIASVISSDSSGERALPVRS